MYANATIAERVGGLERVVESTTVTHSRAEWTGGIFYFPWHRHLYRRDRRLLVSPPKDTGKAG